MALSFIVILRLTAKQIQSFSYKKTVSLVEVHLIDIVFFIDRVALAKQGDNALGHGSVRPSICLSVRPSPLSRLNRKEQRRVIISPWSLSVC